MLYLMVPPFLPLLYTAMIHDTNFPFLSQTTTRGSSFLPLPQRRLGTRPFVHFCSDDVKGEVGGRRDERRGAGQGETPMREKGGRTPTRDTNEEAGQGETPTREQGGRTRTRDTNEAGQGRAQATTPGKTQDPPPYTARRRCRRAYLPSPPPCSLSPQAASILLKK